LAKRRTWNNSIEANESSATQRGQTMKTPYYRCEDCGHEFETPDFGPDIEESPLTCPVCDGLDIQLVERSAPASGEAA
jgi:rubrerythrin